jgi:hypothetical protein
MKKPSLRIAAGCISVLGFLAACSDNIVDPRLPFGAKPFTPPSFYADWWEMTKACSGRSGSLSDVTWYTVPQGTPLELDGQYVSAYWSAASNQIVLSESVRDNGQVIRHEMLHALLRAKGHARAEFLERCGGVVSCGSQCVEDAGPGPEIPASVPRVEPSAIEVTVDIAPVPIRSWVNEGYFAVTVRARNPATHPVLVNLPISSGMQISFRYQIFGPNTESDWVTAWDSAVMSFAPGETKLHVFDFLVGDGNRHGYVFPGQYTMLGGYGTQSSPYYTFQVH